MPPAIHITGTNGKGSTGAFIRAMAEAAGLKVHVFTSPHLKRVNERIRVAGGWSRTMSWPTCWLTSGGARKRSPISRR